jgi:acyl-CoA thioester hydrolase
MSYEYYLTRRVEFSETDMAGIMHFSNFFRFMEAAEHAFFRSLGYSVVLSRQGIELCLPRVHAECDYEAPLHFEEEVLVHLLVEKKGKRSLTYQFHFHRLNESGQQRAANGRLTVVFAARQKDGSLKAAPLPKALADKIQVAPPHVLNGAHHPAKNSTPAVRAAKESIRVGSGPDLQTDPSIRNHNLNS